MKRQIWRNGRENLKYFLFKDVFDKCMYYVGEGVRRLRHAKRFMAVPSPLPAVEWWRVSFHLLSKSPCRPCGVP